MNQTQYIKAINKAAQDVLSNLPVTVNCPDFHHNKRDQHQNLMGPCPPTERYFSAINILSTILQTTITEEVSPTIDMGWTDRVIYAGGRIENNQIIFDSVDQVRKFVVAVLKDSHLLTS